MKINLLTSNLKSLPLKRKINQFSYITEKEGKEKLLPELRKKSRRDYLAKREEDKLIEAEADIADDEFLYDESQLTEREKAERKYKKTVVKLAKDHKNLKEIENVKRYKMPEDRKKGELVRFSYI